MDRGVIGRRLRLSSGSPPGSLTVLVLGGAIAALVAVCVATALPPGSMVAAQPQSIRTGPLEWTRLFASAQLIAFMLFCASLLLVRHRAPSKGKVLLLAATIQLLPLAGPLMLSTDAWSYLNAGRIAVVHGGNPYEDVPDAFSEDPTIGYINPTWRDDTIVYGPAFVAGSEGIARIAQDQLTLALWLFKAIGGASMVLVTVVVSSIAKRAAFAAVFIGWNPVFAIQFAGSGHNDVIVAAAVVLALALGARARSHEAGMAWTLAVLLKWTPLILIPLQLLADRAGHKRSILPGLAVGSALLATASTVLFGWSWLGTFGPLADHASSTEVNSLAIWPRLADWLPSTLIKLGPLVAFGVAYAFLLWEASRGRARHGLTMVLFLVASPFLFTWYVVMPAALSAIEDDILAIWLVLGLTAYTGLLYLGRVGSLFDVFGW